MITSITYNIEELFHVYSHINELKSIDWLKDKKIVELKLSSLLEGIWVYTPKRKMITHTFSTYFKK